jgi:hypothetical protein
MKLDNRVVIDNLRPLTAWTASRNGLEKLAVTFDLGASPWPFQPVVRTQHGRWTRLSDLTLVVRVPQMESRTAALRLTAK